MPIENLEEEGLAKIPNLRVANLAFLLTLNGNNEAVWMELLDLIKKDSK